MESIKKMLEQAQNEFDPSKKRTLLNKVLSLDPENPDALKALLYLGRLGEKGVKTGDYSAIRSYCLNIFDQPENYRPEDIASVIREMTDSDALQACLRVVPEKEEFLRTYLSHISREYVRVFLEGDNLRNGSFMGLRLGNPRNRMTRYAVNMMLNVRKTQLPAPFDTLLPEALMDAFDHCWDNLDLIKRELEKT